MHFRGDLWITLGNQLFELDSSVYVNAMAAYYALNGNNDFQTSANLIHSWVTTMIHEQIAWEVYENIRMVCVHFLLFTRQLWETAILLEANFGRSECLKVKYNELLSKVWNCTAPDGLINLLGSISIWRHYLASIGIPIIKVRRSRHLIFITWISIPGKTVFTLNQGPRP